jgi:phosphoenolpyruvate synthase/pyruvate phosphate dikinase
MMHSLKIDPNKIIIAPVVQSMVPSEISGVLFTANPIDGNPGEILMDAAFGLGEAVVSGSLRPQDIEWAYSKVKLFLLQSRKIAGVAPAASKAE